MPGETRRLHLGYLDGLRGNAALFVVLHHMWQFVITTCNLQRPPRWFSVFSVLKFGDQAVTVFIVLSGYCLMLPVASRADSALAGGFSGFVARRARRILPPYYATLLLCVILLLAVPELARLGKTQWNFALPALGADNLALHALLVHNWSEPWRWKLNPPLWSVALEWQIYFVFAAVLLPLWRKLGAWWTLAAAVALGLSPILLGLGYGKPWYLVSFALGMCAAAINFSPQLAQHAISKRVPWSAVAAIFALASAPMLLASPPWLPVVVIDLCVSVATGAFLVSATQQLAERREGWLMPLFSNRWSLKLGEFSYSLYLIHYPLVALFCVSVWPLSTRAALGFLQLVLVCLPAVLLASFAFHLAFERPFLRKKPL